MEGDKRFKVQKTEKLNNNCERVIPWNDQFKNP